ncbi:low temperature requirement protein A [Geobacter pelophilus]|uniref:Low temperature requirement protein A n=1 Tax=Geoanaerobacter pelophilus TaxID=60036 RepID=A0AAW4L7Z3_9BACT|nr:low temperature requirement protein A [Geoanaerobacter pelophilus]MBT0664149.1 low temperature requirement protein A [Geoanaerobacter pelophilus]
MLKKGLIKPPTLRSANTAEVERHATWLELFYDLVFVAALSQLANGLSADYSPTGFLKFAMIFIPVWWAWAGHTFYLSRFDTEDLLHRLLTMLQMTAVASLAVHVPTALTTGSAGFALSYATVRFILVAEYIRAGRHIPAVRPLTDRYVHGFGAAAALWAGSILIPAPWRFWLWGAALLVDFAAPLTAGQLHVRFPPHLSHLPERFGLFTIIVIGEAVASVVFGIGKNGLTLVSALAGLMGLLIAFALWWGYFEGAKGAMTRRLQARSHLKYYQQWLYAHLPLLMGITAVAVGIKHVISLQPTEPLPLFERWLLCCSMGLTVLALSAIFLASTREEEMGMIRRLALPYYLIAFLGIATGSLSRQLPGLAILAILTLLCIAQIGISLMAITDDGDP